MNSETKDEWYIPRDINLDRRQGNSYERFLYFGCIHGGSPEFFGQLDQLITSPDSQLPNFIFLTGDITGAKDQKTIRQKQLFYDYLMNRASPVLSQNPDISAEDLLNNPGNLPPEDSPTIYSGALSLLRFAIKDMGGTDIVSYDQIKQLAHTQMGSEDENVSTDATIDRYIRWIYSTNLNSGTWVGTLPDVIRQRYTDQYEDSGVEIGRSLTSLRDRNINLIWLEGNEDNSASLNNIAHGLSRVFDIQDYFKSIGIECQREIGGIETRSTYHLWLPFFEALNYENIDGAKLDDLKNQVESARRQSKPIILVSHVQKEWERHFPGQSAKGDAAKIIENVRKAINDFNPDELVHSHQHAEMPHAPHLNAKFISDRTIVSYIPLLRTGELTVSVDDATNRALEYFGGTRQPVRRVT